MPVSDILFRCTRFHPLVGVSVDWSISRRLLVLVLDNDSPAVSSSPATGCPDVGDI